MRVNRNQFNRLDRLKRGILSYVSQYNKSRSLTKDQKDEIKTRINHRKVQYQSLFSKMYDMEDQTIKDLIIYN